MSPVDDEPPEHARYERHRLALAAVTEHDEAALVGAVLDDPDRVMAEAAIAGHIDARAAALHPLPSYPAWSETIAELIEDRPFLVRRLGEWTLFRAIALGDPWQAEDLTEATDWLQRKVSDSSASAEALAVLAERGRTKRVRNAAARKVSSRRR
ncbi:hypothetical protein B1H26_19410 [Amycolatopsis sp. BJA-103]|nr:hypothetical protein BKN51_15130 [Amycolatopsis sp. BJA-103]PNE17132.1 hypothetical protein B1H26_19410 [Amycolatopsis sp. BJA-103]